MSLEISSRGLLALPRRAVRRMVKRMHFENQAKIGFALAAPDFDFKITVHQYDLTNLTDAHLQLVVDNVTIHQQMRLKEMFYDRDLTFDTVIQFDGKGNSREPQTVDPRTLRRLYLLGEDSPKRDRFFAKVLVEAVNLTLLYSDHRGIVQTNDLHRLRSLHTLKLPNCTLRGVGLAELGDLQSLTRLSIKSWALEKDGGAQVSPHVAFCSKTITKLTVGELPLSNSTRVDMPNLQKLTVRTTGDLSLFADCVELRGNIVQNGKYIGD